ncbi:MAG: cobalt transporter CbiM [Methanocalculus sp. MSAO_Arc1]|uniref:cobalt transporter CbiM n=1 Tax=Methanocalculus TaxID=71151 RepID=UPI000FF7EBE9|nr:MULTISPECIES: cobalt transporter CbiM [unclassified Methanocalculus]MCP1662404.1 cobalt/nickel transport system permease protein [Methanocalculus sp. AMF5]RQD79469.1 MAG: cobalt transporter CbiM [Methanocalculus sp. MSAO_Arc1]
MVHISDGILPMPVVAAGWIITILLLAITYRWAGRQDDLTQQIPKLSVMVGAFFVASLIHIDIPPSSAHLILNGLVGIVLGPLSYIGIFIGLTLQALLFQHGGITVIGVNALILGVPALICYLSFLIASGRGLPLTLIGGICGGFAVSASVCLLVATLVISGSEFRAVAGLLAIAHIPIIITEAIITGVIVGYLVRVKPELLPIHLKGEKK